MDFAGALPRDHSTQTQFIQSKYPIVIGIKTNVMFLADNIKPWRGIQSLNNKRVGATHAFAKLLEGITVEFSEIPKREQIIKMLVRGRIDFYMDDEQDMTLTLKKHQALIEKYKYQIEPVMKSSWYMNAPNTPRGREIMNIYDENFKKLHQSGELEKVYNTTSFSLPSLDE